MDTTDDQPPVEQATPTEVEPQKPTPKKVDPSKPKDEDVDINSRIEELESKLREARKESEKRRKQSRESRMEAGQYESLYSEAQQELAEISTERDQLKTQFETLDQKIKQQDQEISGYRNALLDQFEEADRELAAEYSLARLPELYNRLYGRTLLQKPAPSPGAHKPNTKQAGGVLSLDEAKATGDPAKINAAFEEALKTLRR